jgi:hypothetical protein
MSKPILCVDFDGVIHSYTSGWKGADVVSDPPVAGALKWLFKAREWWDVQIYSSRTSQEGGIEAMKLWLLRHAIMEFELPGTPPDEDGPSARFMRSISFPTQKPAAFLTIDDRAICFEGDWSELDARKLTQFKPWNKRPVGATGTFPDGQLNDDDQGALQMAIGRDPADGLVHVDFGKPISWFALPPDAAINMARSLLRHAGAKKIEIEI